MRRDSHGRFTAEESTDGKTLIHDVVELESEAAGQPEMSREEHEEVVKAANAMKKEQERIAEESAIIRVPVADDSVMTILTFALMAKFTVVWGEYPLKCSGDPDALRRLPEILDWLERAIPRARNLAPRMFELACYVNWRVRKKLSDILQFDPSVMHNLEVDPRFVHDYIHKLPPEERKHGVLRSQKPVLMKDLNMAQLIMYTVEPRKQVVFWLQANWRPNGPMRAKLEQLPPTSSSGRALSLSLPSSTL